MNKTPTLRWLAAFLTTVLLGLGLVASYALWQRPLVIAPMLGGLNPCLFNKSELIKHLPNTIYSKACAEDEKSAAGVVSHSLHRMAPEKSLFGDFQMGYTLNVPLFLLFKESHSGYTINRESVDRIARTIQNVDHPVVLYLFSNHFSVGGALEQSLAQNPENLLLSRSGPMAVDYYYGAKVYPWNFVNIEAPVTKMREQAIHAVLDRVCSLPRHAQKKIIGVTLLGELHHMYPNFQGGMGYNGEYLTSDYSAQSIEGFKKYLENKYQNIQALNIHLGSSFGSFNEVPPPRKNIRTERLQNYWEHIDSFAHGILPISGWLANLSSLGTASSDQHWIHVYDNGTFLGRTRIAFGRQDVIEAHPELPSANVGWQYDWDYTKAEPGIHKIDVFYTHGTAPLVHLGYRDVAIMDRKQSTPKVLPVSPLPAAVKPHSKTILFQVDQPANLASFYFNPLAPDWHAFRASQVGRYLEHFAKIAKGKCLPHDAVYAHQILPFVNPGWDETKFGIGRDLAVPPGIQLGISLYGEASYGTSFFDWMRSQKRNGYGITEFHPLRSMSAPELSGVFQHHRKNGARFLSFFAESTGWDEDPANQPNLFSFDKNNKNAGSDALYESTQAIFQKQ